VDVFARNYERFVAGEPDAMENRAL
jgi:hypothetical protein